MNGVHDLGGMHGFGPVEREPDEPVFHASWEAVVVAIRRSKAIGRLFTIDEFRHSVERMDPAHYLRSSYYEHWLDGLVRVLVEKDVVTPEELDARAASLGERPEALARAAGTRPRLDNAPGPQNPLNFIPASTVRPSSAAPRFAAGDPVLTRSVHPVGHTRLPRYARGKPGVIHRLHGTHVFPDTNAHGRGEQPQPLYSVRFDARVLWGESAEPNQQVYLDLFESYLRPSDDRP
ncbi:MAG TPA: nitrile hydratase subunit beta [Candidatus Limnocylindrales bacterium]|nr:nitrile hydratase subunit beta [Candidatus Limnocylindrales bacterium]